jgi:hypothetical protein
MRRTMASQRRRRRESSKRAIGSPKRASGIPLRNCSAQSNVGSRAMSTSLNIRRGKYVVASFELVVHRSSAAACTRFPLSVSAIEIGRVLLGRFGVILVWMTALEHGGWRPESLHFHDREPAAFKMRASPLKALTLNDYFPATREIPVCSLVLAEARRYFRTHAVRLGHPPLARTGDLSGWYRSQLSSVGANGSGRRASGSFALSPLG